MALNHKIVISSVFWFLIQTSTISLNVYYTLFENLLFKEDTNKLVYIRQMTAHKRPPLWSLPWSLWDFSVLLNLCPFLMGGVSLYSGPQTFWSERLHILQNCWGPKSFYLCELNLFIFSMLAIKPEKYIFILWQWQW